MNKLNNKGFTLIEMLAVIAIIAVIGLIAVPNVISSLNTSKQASYDILVENITISSKQIFEELEYTEGKLFFYDVKNGKTNTLLEIEEDKLNLNLQTLVSNGFLTGTNNSNNTDNINTKIVTNPKTKEDIGACQIIITKTVDETTFSTNYKIESNSSEENCPTTEEYEKVLKQGG